MTDRLPDFLGIGTQKGGTTSLQQWLTRHPSVFMPENKELHYFDTESEKTLDWYKNQFKDANANQICGEITPFYMFHPCAPERIKKTIPRARLIVLLRDPVERTISQFNHSTKRGFENLSIEKALEAEEERLEKGNIYSFQKHSYFNRSLYLKQLDRYEKLFNRNQIIVLKSESMFEQGKHTIKKLRKFLQIKEEMNIEVPVANKGTLTSQKVSNKTRKLLEERLKETAIGIRKRYGFGWDWAD